MSGYFLFKSNFLSVLKGLTARNTLLTKSLYHTASDYYCIWTEGSTRGRPRHHHIHYVLVYKSHVQYTCTVVCKFSTFMPKQCVDTNLSFCNFFLSAFLNHFSMMKRLLRFQCPEVFKLLAKKLVISRATLRNNIQHCPFFEGTML